MVNDSDLLQSDLAELLTLLGMGDHARSQSPHEVFQEALGVLREWLTVQRQADAQHAAEIVCHDEQMPVRSGEVVAALSEGETAIKRSKEWWLEKARAEGDSSVSAGLMRDDGLLWLQREIAELCEDTEDKCAVAIEANDQGEHALGFNRGRAYEAKGIRRTISAAIQERIRDRNL